jgi:hypothetical protein
MARRGKIIVQNAAIPLAPGTGPRYKRRVQSAAQRGWQISGEVVVPAAQSWLGAPPVGQTIVFRRLSTCRRLRLIPQTSPIRELFPPARCLLLCKADFFLIS